MTKLKATLRGDIKFNRDTYEAMMALLRFIDYEYRFTEEYSEKPLNYKATVDAFEKYVSENRLTSPRIVQCGCTHPISNREVIFNTCLTCKGPVSKDFLAHPNQKW